MEIGIAQQQKTNVLSDRQASISIYAEVYFGYQMILCFANLENNANLGDESKLSFNPIISQCWKKFPKVAVEFVRISISV